MGVFVDLPAPFSILAALSVGALGLFLITCPTKPAIFGKLTALVNVYVILHASVAADLLLLFSFLFIRPYSGHLARKWNSEVAQALWVQAMTVVFPWTDLVITGDMPDDDTQAVIISNHQLDCDWWYIWELMRWLGRHGDVKVILKDNYKNLPIIGWGLRGFQFIMLARNWQKDGAALRRQLAVFKRDHFPLRLVIFPEGTTMNVRDMEKSLKFAKEKNKPTYKLLVVPRTTGFLACVEGLLAATNGNGAHESSVNGDTGASSTGGSGGGNGRAVEGKPPVVYDITMAYEGYSGEVPTWEMGYDRAVDTLMPSGGKLLAGQRARPVHLHIVRYTAKEAAAGGEAWVEARWAEKERLLEGFIREGKFPGEPRSVRPRPAVPGFLFALALPVLAGSGVWAAGTRAVGAWAA